MRTTEVAPLTKGGQGGGEDDGGRPLTKVGRPGAKTALARKMIEVSNLL